MSVINQMLVDLERRRASGEERNRIPDHVRALPDEPQSTYGPAFRITGAVVSMALLAAGVWWWQVGRLPAVPASAPVPIAATMPAPALTPEARDTE